MTDSSVGDDLATPSSADFEKRFFAGAEIVELNIKVLQETYDDILAAIQRNGWEVEEGLRILLTLGLGYAQGRRFLQADDEQRRRLAERLSDLESVAAAMKFRTFSFMRDNQVLEMRSAALQTSVGGMKAVIKRLQPERDELKAERDRLRTEVKALQDRLGGILIEGVPAATAPTVDCGLLPFLKSIYTALRRVFNGNHDQSGTRAA